MHITHEHSVGTTQSTGSSLIRLFTDPLTPCRVTTAPYSENRTKHIHTLPHKIQSSVTLQ
jgi:hypothetical protein